MDIHRYSQQGKFLFDNEVYGIFDALRPEEVGLDNICPLFWRMLFTYVFVTFMYTLLIVTLVMWVPTLLNQFDIISIRGLPKDLFTSGHHMLSVLTAIGITISFLSMLLAVAFVFMGAAVLLIGGLRFVRLEFLAWRNRRRLAKQLEAGYEGQPEEPNLFALRYRALKEKTCVKVNWVR